MDKYQLLFYIRVYSFTFFSTSNWPLYAVEIMTSLPANIWCTHLQNHVAPTNLVHALAL